MVNRALEQLRADGIIGSSLEAEVALYADDDLVKSLAKLKDEIRFILITSTASVHPISLATESAIVTELPNLKLLITKTAFPKCARCWHHNVNVGSHSEHPELCSRCFNNLFGEGEERTFA
jgi:isoleucyl-tRNA synthetase